jgi:phosphoheptose isomerase
MILLKKDVKIERLASIEILRDLHDRHPNININPIYNTIESFVNCFKHNNKILICGNGGKCE